MKNQLTGTVEYVSEITEIKGREKTNNQRTLVITAYEDTDYPKKVAFIAWNKVADQLDAIRVNDVVTVDFKISSREYNSRFYTEATIVDFSITKQHDERSPKNTSTEANTAQTATNSSTTEQTGDLPF